MAGFKVADFVKEVTDGSAEGTTGVFKLAGPPSGQFHGFVDAIGDGNTTVFSVTDGTKSEFWKGTVTDGAPDTLTGVTWLSSTTGTQINWGAGTKTISCSLAAEMIGGSNPEDVPTQAQLVNSGFPSGTKMVFKQATAPTGWTQDTSVNDRVLRMVSGAPGADGGSWVISGGSITVDGHVLSVSEIPSHRHRVLGGSGGDLSMASNASAFMGANTNNGYTDISPGSGAAWVENTGGNAAHAHTGSVSFNGTWRPAYTDVIVAQRN